MKEDFLIKRLDERKEQNAFRSLSLPDGKVDFCSNDYLGIVKNSLLQHQMAAATGSTGSRLLAGNYPLIEQVERELAHFHHGKAGLIYNSGYDANMGLLSSVPQKQDTIIYDALSHASLRDGIRLSFAKSYSFIHNCLSDLEKKLKPPASGTVFVVTESVFSMDGDLAPLAAIAHLCEEYGAQLIVDEAHATGIIGDKGEGLVQFLGLEDKCFARIHTFGKAVGAHGAIIIGSDLLRQYLVNFSRAFIYTTALPESSLQIIRASYTLFPNMNKERSKLIELIKILQNTRTPYNLLPGSTPIQAMIVPGNDAVKKLSAYLQEAAFDVRPILSPTVPKGSERLRIVLHAFNTETELEQLIQKITYF